MRGLIAAVIDAGEAVSTSKPGRLKILLVAARYPWPPRRGDEMRAAQALAALAPVHAVTLLAPRPVGEPAPPPAGLEFRLELYEPAGLMNLPFGLARAASRGWPYQTALFAAPDLRRKIRLLAPQADLGILPLARLAPYVEDFGALPLIVDLIDSLALNFERRARVDRPWLRPLWLHEAARLERAERRMVERSLRTVVVCERDRADLARRAGSDAARKLSVVGVAVEGGEASALGEAACGEDEPAERAADRRSAGSVDRGSSRNAAPPVLALTGNLGYFVNADAARWFLREVWPGLRQRRADLRLLLAGARPGRALRRAADQPGVELVPSPPDLRALLRSATLALAPMRCGSGVPIKVLEAWALGVPVVASAWAAAGTPGVAGVDLAVPGDDPESWIETILSLLEAPGERERLARGGWARLAAVASPEAVSRAWRATVAGLPLR